MKKSDHPNHIDYLLDILDENCHASLQAFFLNMKLSYTLATTGNVIQNGSPPKKKLSRVSVRKIKKS
ncbi:MAG: hypothetical protein ABI254_02850 [Chthoniobacterales bacterium]